VNGLLARPLDTPVPEIADSLLCFELPLNQDSVLTIALGRREELQQAGEGVGAAQAAVRVANAALLPSVALALDVGYQGRQLSFGRDQDFMVASVVVSWNVFDSGRNLAGRSRAKAEVDRAGAARRAVEDAVRQDVQNAWQAAVVSRNALGPAEDRVAAARRTFDLVRRRYEEGMASPIEFVDARSTLTAAELNRTLTFYRWAMRWVDLERAAALRVIE
jgi:outer membrane protein TolC